MLVQNHQSRPPAHKTSQRNSSLDDDDVCFDKIQAATRTTTNNYTAVAASMLHCPVSSQFSSTKSCTDSHRNTLVRSTMSPTFLAADLSVLLAPTVWQCRRPS